MLEEIALPFQLLAIKTFFLFLLPFSRGVHLPDCGDSPQWWAERWVYMWSLFFSFWCISRVELYLSFKNPDNKYVQAKREWIFWNRSQILEMKKSSSPLVHLVWVWIELLKSVMTILREEISFDPKKNIVLFILLNVQSSHCTNLDMLNWNSDTKPHRAPIVSFDMF